MDPLQAGIRLIAFGLGNMVFSIVSGALGDRIGMRNLAVAGPLVAVAGTAGLSQFDRTTTDAMIWGTLFVAGAGFGVFGSPNGAAQMLSVPPTQRGVAASVSMVTLMFTSMLGIVLTFMFVLHSMSQGQLFVLFVYGGGNLSSEAVASCLAALRSDYWIVLAAEAAAAFFAAGIPSGFRGRPPAPPASAAKAAADVELAPIATNEDGSSSSSAAHAAAAGSSHAHTHEAVVMPTTPSAVGVIVTGEVVEDDGAASPTSAHVA